MGTEVYVQVIEDLLASRGEMLNKHLPRDWFTAGWANGLLVQRRHSEIRAPWGGTSSWSILGRLSPYLGRIWLEDQVHSSWTRAR